MAQPRYYIQMMSPANWEPVEYFEETISVQWSRKINAVGEAKITVPQTKPISAFPRNTRVLIWREKDQSQTLAGQTIWVVRKITHNLEDNTFQFLAKDANTLIGNRIVAYSSHSVFADKTQEEFEWLTKVVPTLPPVSDDMIKQYVSENMGPDAIDTARDLTTTGLLTIDADQTLGTFVEKTAAWQNLLSTIQDVAKQSKDAGTPIYFDMVPDPITGTFAFRTWKDFRGRDRTADSQNPLTFSQELENLSKVQLEFDYTTEFNVFYYVGLGSAGGNDMGNSPYTNDKSLVGDPFGRREFMVSDSEKTNEDGIMDSLARGFLEGATAQVTMKGRALDTPLSQYGVDFDFGDLVSARAGSYEFDCLVEAVAGTYRNGEEKLDIKLSSTVPVFK